LIKSIKALEEQLSNLKDDGSEKINNSGGNSSEYFKRICKDVMANIEVCTFRYLIIRFFVLFRKISKLNKA
jgi:hypothetical protein